MHIAYRNYLVRFLLMVLQCVVGVLIILSMMTKVG